MLLEPDPRHWLIEQGWPELLENELKPSIELLKNSGCLEQLITYWIQEKFLQDALTKDIKNAKNSDQFKSDAAANENLLSYLKLCWGKHQDSLFLKYQRDLDKVTCNYIILEDKSLALEVYHRIKASEISFSQAVAEFGTFKNNKKKYGMLMDKPVSSLPYDLDKVVNLMKPGQVISPLRIEKEFCIVQLLDLIRAKLDDQSIDSLMFFAYKDWLNLTQKVANDYL